MTSSEPKTLERYAVLDTLGQGGMGVVLRAFDRELDRPVALKVLHEGLGDEDTARLRREARAMAKLSHPNVVQVYEVGELEGRTFVAMELVKGQTAKQWMQQDPRPDWKACVRLFVQLGEGLAAAHERGLIHRDFKPGNAMIDDKGRPRVLDFGLARHDETGDAEHESMASQRARSGTQQAVLLEESLTETGMVMGTPAYMPPEQMAGRETDARSDQFSFCVSLYEAVYGERPFEGDSMLALMVSIRNGVVRPPPKGLKVPSSLRSVLLRGLAAEPDDRWRSMEELLERLRRLVAPKRRRWMVGGLTVGLASVGAGVAYGEYLQLEDRCTGAQAELEGIWDDERRQEVRAAILATGLSYAPSTWARVEQRLDAYAQAWVDRHTEVCEATTVRGEQSEEHMGLRMGCLRARQRHLRATVDELTRMEASVVENAIDMASGLPGLDRCDDLDALRATVSPPEDPRVARDVEDLREQLASVEARQDAGRYVVAHQQVEPLVEQALALGYGPLVAEARARRGVLRQRNGQYEEAERDLLEAYELAMEHRHDEIALYAVQRLAVVSGVERKRAAEGRLWSRAAVAHAKRSGDELELAQSLSNLGAVLGAQGRYEQAQLTHEQALEIRARILGAEHPTVAASLHRLASVLTERGEYVLAQEHAEQALEINEEALGVDHPRVASSLRLLADALMLQGEYERAQRHYERALEIKQAALGADHISLAGPLSNLGRALWGQGSYERAQQHYERALRIQQDVLGGDHPEVATTLSNLGYMLMLRSRHDHAQQHMERALRIQEAALDPDNPSVAQTLGMLANVLVRRGRHAQARTHLERALHIQEQALGAEHPAVAATLSDLATAIGHLGDYEQTRRLYERALRIREQAPDLDPRFVAQSVANVANVVALQGDHQLARQHYERALRMMEVALGADHPDLSIVLDGLGTSLFELGEHELAEQRFARDLELRQKALGPEHPDLSFPLLGLAELALARGEHDEARTHAERALTLRERANVPPPELVQAQFLLARAAWHDPSQRADARALAERALVGLAEEAEARKDEIAELQAWLATHRAR